MAEMAEPMTKSPSPGALALLFALALSSPAAADVSAGLVISRAASPIRIDGVLDEAAWQQATAIPVDHEWFPGREGESYRNHVAGIDGVYRFTGSDVVRYQLAGSTTRYPDGFARAQGEPAGSFDGHAYAGRDRVDLTQTDRTVFLKIGYALLL
jgi:hypothetical protein